MSASRRSSTRRLVSTSPLDGASTYDSTSASSAPDLNTTSRNVSAAAPSTAPSTTSPSKASPSSRIGTAAPSDGSKPNASTGECAPREGAAAESCSAPARAASARSPAATSSDAHLSASAAASSSSFLSRFLSSAPDASSAGASFVVVGVSDVGSDVARMVASHLLSMAGLCAGSHSATARSRRATASSIITCRPWSTRARTACPRRLARSSAKDVTDESAARAAPPTLPTAPAASRALCPIDTSQLIDVFVRFFPPGGAVVYLSPRGGSRPTTPRLVWVRGSRARARRRLDDPRDTPARVVRRLARRVVCAQRLAPATSTAWRQFRGNTRVARQMLRSSHGSALSTSGHRRSSSITSSSAAATRARTARAIGL